MEYGPDFDLEVHAGNRKNDNTAPYLKQVYGMVMSKYLALYATFLNLLKSSS